MCLKVAQTEIVLNTRKSLPVLPSLPLLRLIVDFLSVLSVTGTPLVLNRHIFFYNCQKVSGHRSNFPNRISLYGSENGIPHDCIDFGCTKVFVCVFVVRRVCL